ncbi:metalloprotease [Cyathus striatus]|nr:metalloprotease [Cyathus striatus]
MFSTLLPALFATPASLFLLSDAQDPFHRCGTFITQQHILAAEHQFQIDKALPTTPNREDCHYGPVNVYFHIVAANHTVEGGWLSDTAINDQMSVLNEDFNSTGLQWTLAGVDRTINETWFRHVYPDTELEYEMKTQLRIGDVFDLNIFTVGFVGTGLLGVATFPAEYIDFPTLDGIVLRDSSFPGGTANHYNLGKTAVHEAGHWVGLYHTFQGGCYGVGDMVDDTPAEFNNTHICVSQPGLDPIHNYMDYSYDSCVYELTPGQTARMRDQLRTYRNIWI